MVHRSRGFQVPMTGAARSEDCPARCKRQAGLRGSPGERWRPPLASGRAVELPELGSLVSRIRPADRNPADCVRNRRPGCQARTLGQERDEGTVRSVGMDERAQQNAPGRTYGRPADHRPQAPSCTFPRRLAVYPGADRQPLHDPVFGTRLQPGFPVLLAVSTGSCDRARPPYTVPLESDSSLGTQGDVPVVATDDALRDQQPPKPAEVIALLEQPELGPPATLDLFPKLHVQGHRLGRRPP